MHKDIILAVCVLVTVAAVAVSINSFERKNKLYKTLQEERYGRMVAEESLQKNSAKVATLENQLKTSEEKMAKVKQIVDQEKNVNSDLKGQYERLVKTKAALEDKLNSALQEQKAQQAELAQAQPPSSSQPNDTAPLASSAAAGAH